MEIWKDILGYEGLYQVSSYGRIKSLSRKRNNGLDKTIILKENINNKGYKRINLHKNKKMKSYLVHRLVAQAFIPNPNNYPIINHKDENPSNNHVSNLEWCTYKYNNNYGTKGEKISKALKGNRSKDKHPFYGRHHSEEAKAKMKMNHADFKEGKHPKARKVICINTGEIFNSLSKATKWCNIKNSCNIGECCRGKHKTAGKHPITGEPLKWKWR